MNIFEEEVKKGQRFEFGKNWQSFLSTLTDKKIEVAETSILEMLAADSLHNKTFLDIGSGSGLFSLAARRLGAKVHSIDYDPESVACTFELYKQFYSNDPNWKIEEGSALDNQHLHSLGQFDIVYSWGVLHHTGDMWSALENVAALVKKGGALFIGIYNDQGRQSRAWWKVKKYYCSGLLGKVIVSGIFIPYFFTRTLLASLLKRENRFSKHKENRGMSITHDWFDWLGGFPFEVATVEEIFHFYKERGFVLNNIKTSIGLGINQFVFVKE